MNFLESVLKNSDGFDEISKTLNEGKTAVASSLSGVQKANMISTLCHLKNVRAFCAAQSENEAQTLANDLSMMGIRAYVYPRKDFALLEVESKSNEYEHKRIKILSKLIDKTCDVVISTIDAASQFTMPKETLKEASVKLYPSLEISLEELIEKLILIGYTKTDNVEGTGQFAVRGGIVDLFMPDAENPIRIEFFGDEIETINYFDVLTQRRTDYCEKIYLTPSSEILIKDKDKLIKDIQRKASYTKNEKAKSYLLKDIDLLENNISLGNIDKYIKLIYENETTLFDYFDDDDIMFFSEYRNIKERNKSIEFHDKEEMLSLLEEGFLSKGFDRYSLSFNESISIMLTHPALFMDAFSHANYDTDISCVKSFNTKTPSAWNGQFSLLCEDLNEISYKEWSVVILAGTEKAARKLSEDLNEKGYINEYKDHLEKAEKNKLYITKGLLSSGIEFTKEKFLLLTHSQMLLKSTRRKLKVKNGQQIYSLSDLQNGEYVVHTTHGIGIYRGIHKVEFQGIIKDYIKIEYAKSDILYVPVTQLDLVAKYIGPREDSKVKINTLGTSSWEKQKARVKSAAKEIAKDLIELYSKRMNSRGFAFSYDAEWQHDFESEFEYEETDDQLRCCKEIKKDMENIVPMDRLLCGDVGFGKTEVALRAAFKCVCDSKQCALLCPTTILSWQHFQTVVKRFDKYPVNVEVLSRFKTKKEQTEIIQKLKEGKIDIIIGTHRLLQDDISFYDLGLVIIDEEQRFGVAQKEKFKQLKENVDVLTLSATPIPRTLNMAMSGIRDMSVIEEAPENRHPVQTFVLEYDKAIINEAIRKEIRRGGQVFYLHNTVENILTTAAKIKKDIPEANIAVAHGQMSETELSKIWEDMLNGEINVLVCTTIIETGVDLPNANTLIIENADRFGLSQLHQIRGRVGRSPRRAYAYFTYYAGKILSEISQKRLQAIKEFTEFGSGYKIAMRDLELRGAGNILGAQQHGHMGDVGYDMYLKILAEAVNEEKGIEKKKEEKDCLIDISLNAHIPESYIDSLNNRLDVYRMISLIKSKEDKKEVIDELVDRYGDIPESVLGLIDVSFIRSLASSYGIYEIKQNDTGLILYISDIKDKEIIKLLYRQNGKAMLNASKKPYIMIKCQKSEILNSLKELFSV